MQHTLTGAKLRGQVRLKVYVKEMNEVSRNLFLQQQLVSLCSNTVVEHS